MMFGDDVKARMLRTLARPERAIVSPPWETAREAVGFEFPEDFRWFISTYGSGTVNDYLGVFPVSSPYAKSARTSGFEKLLGWSRSIDSCGGDGRHSDPPYCDVNWNGRILTFAADSPDGLLLQWGQDDGGNMCYWARETADSDTWPVMVHKHNAGMWFRFEGGFVECLLAMMEETFPIPGRPINPERRWEHARAQPVWKCEGDWNGIFE
jgi:hypothetical protein